MIAQIEDAIIEHLKVALTPAAVGYQVKEIDSYGGELDELLPETVRRFPAVWITYAGSDRPKAMSTKRDTWLMPAKFAVMTAARSVRGERFTRHNLAPGGVIAEVGAYQILADARLALINQDFGIAIERLAPGATRTLYNTRLNNQALAVFAQEWNTAFVVAAPAQPIDPTDPDWLRLGLEYRLKPGDDITDVADTITLAAA